MSADDVERRARLAPEPSLAADVRRLWATRDDAFAALGEANRRGLTAADAAAFTSAMAAFDAGMGAVIRSTGRRGVQLLTEHNGQVWAAYRTGRSARIA